MNQFVTERLILRNWQDRDRELANLKSGKRGTV